MDLPENLDDLHPARAHLIQLYRAGYGPRKVASLMDVSERTLHRWLVGETEPQRERDISDLTKLSGELLAPPV